MKKLIQGVGINDAGYVTRIEEELPLTETGKRRRNVVWRCPFYTRWESMLLRTNSSNYQSSRPTYVGCSVAEEWLRFSTFKKWMEEQDWEGMDLDKDILVAGNKVYSPSTCAFIPHELNMVLSDSRAARGKYPLGVHLQSDCRVNPYQSQISTKGRRCRLGSYSTIEEAHAAWQRTKIQAIKDVFAEWKNPDPRVAAAIDRIVAKLQDDLDNGRETISFLE